MKNGQAAERRIAVLEYQKEIIQDYLKYNRHDVTDDYGREPFITSKFGRLSGHPIRRMVYEWTRPCMIGGCPHDRDPEDCEAMNESAPSTCPSSISPHAIRRGALTRMLRKGVPEQVVGDRSNVSSEILEKHYDRRSEHERMEKRREFIEQNDQ